MPADPSHIPTVRRANRKQVSEEDVEARRARGEISCAECRRLKLKCDKKLPCNSCIRRGCPSICPNGALSTGQGTSRYVLADTAELHTKIAEMGQRIRQLEDALSIFQSTVSSEIHPLLKEELLSIKYGPDSTTPAEKAPPLVEPVIDALGTMTIGDHGEGKYFGRSAGAEMLLLAGAEADPLHEQDDLPVVKQVSAMFPFGHGYESDIPWDVLFNHLPPEPRAWALCETYLEHATWKFHPITRDQIINEILVPIYRVLKEHKSPGPYNTKDLSAHQFSVLFFIFAVGALMDLTLEAFNQEASLYYHLGRCCLCLRSMFDSQEVITVVAVLLMAQYKGLGARRYTMDGTWYLVSLGVKLAQGLGLHRDSARFRMDAKTIQRRRKLFWELFSMDLFSSLSLGRPPSIRLSDTDCEFPDDDEAVVDENGKTSPGYYRWKYEFTKEVFCLIAERSLTAEAPSYQTILELDRKLREKTLPSYLNTFIDPQDPGFTPSGYMKRCLLGQYRSSTLLYLHRSFCVQAMLEHSKNPLQSPYAPSFLAAYRCASGVIKSTLNHFDRFPELCRRWWTVWTNLFSAAVIIGAIVIRSPASSMASSAYIELGLACDLFEKGVTKGILMSDKANSALAVLHKLRAKALQAYSELHSDRTTQDARSPETPDHGYDELALFGGQTRILVCKWLPNHKEKEALAKSQSKSSKSSSSPAESSAEQSSLSSAEETSQVHPSLVQYISQFPSSEFASFDTGAWGVEGNTGSVAPFITSTGQQFPIQNNAAWPGAFEPQPFGTITINPSTFATMPRVAESAPLPESTMDFQFDPNLDLATVMSGETGIDDQWRAFLQTAGIFQLDQGTQSTNIPSNPVISDSNSTASSQPVDFGSFGKQCFQGPL